MTLKQLEYFLAVAACQNISQAAAQLFISQPALSKQIQSLEKETGITLFERSWHMLALTPLGEEFYQRAKALCYDYHDLISWSQSVGEQGESSLVIGYSGFLLQDILPDILRKMWEKWPKANISIRQANVGDLSGLLGKRKLDVAISTSSYSPPDREIAREIICSLPYRILLSGHHPLAGQKALHLEALSKEPFILFSQQEYFNTYSETLSLLQHYGINPPQLIECGDPTSYYLLIQSGKGVSVNAVRENAIRGYDIRILQIEPQLQEKKDMLAIWNKNQSNPLIPSFLSISKALLNQQES